MSDVNRAELIGYCGADPISNDVGDGLRVTKFSVATTKEWKNKSGEKVKSTEWHRVVAWKQLAEFLGQYLKKGRQVYVDGSLATRKWDDKGGTTHYTTEIIANTVKLLGPSPASSDEPIEKQVENLTEGVDDLPF